MALALTLSSLQHNECTDWILTDNTGEYSSDANLTGWQTTTSGGSNLQVDDGSVLCAEIIIETAAGASVTIDLIDGWATYTGLSNVAFDSSTTPNVLIYTLPSTVLGADVTSFPDGIYTVTYRVGDAATYDTSTPATRSSVTYSYAVYCAIECCIEQRLVTVPTEYECESCSNAFLETTMTLWTLLQALKLSACLADTSKFTNILTTLQTACEEAGCECS